MWPIVAAYDMVDSILAWLTTTRQDIDNVFSTWFTIAVALAAKVDIQPSTPRRTSRQRNRENHPGISPEAYYKQAVAIPLLDSLTTELKTRFTGQKALIVWF